MAESTRVWISTSAIESILHPGGNRPGAARHLSSILTSSNNNDHGGDDNQQQQNNNNRVNWGWTSGTVVSGVGHAGTDGNLAGGGSGGSPIVVEICDPTSEHDRLRISVSGDVVDSGGVVMRNDHRGDRDDYDYDDDDDDDCGDDDGGGGGRRMDRWDIQTIS